MLPFYQNAIISAKRLIATYGIQITLLKLNKVNTTLEPWKVSDTPLQQRQNPIRSTVVSVVYLPVESFVELGFTINSKSMVAKKSKVALFSLQESITGYDEVLDSAGNYYRIINTQTLQPGADAILHAIEIEQ